MNKNSYKIDTYNSSVHIYGGQLIFGDAYKIISELKKSQDGDGAGYHPFLEWDEIQLNKLDWKKRHSIIASNHHGGCWTPIFSSENKNGNIDALFIDTAEAHLFPYFGKSEAHGSKEHLKLINEMIEKTLTKKNPVEYELDFPSGKILFMGSAKEVRFETKDKEIEIDYKTKTEAEIFSQLYQLCYEPNCKFINFETTFDKNTLDFFVDELSYKGMGSHLMFKIDSLVEDIDWFASYYSKYCEVESGKDIYKKQKPSKKSVETLKKWQDEQFSRFDLKSESLDEIEESMKKPLIEKYKDYVERFGFNHGYYIVPENILDE